MLCEFLRVLVLTDGCRAQALSDDWERLGATSRELTLADFEGEAE